MKLKPIYHDDDDALEKEDYISQIAQVNDLLRLRLHCHFLCNFRCCLKASFFLGPKCTEPRFLGPEIEVEKLEISTLLLLSGNGPVSADECHAKMHAV